ncbi:hypothetical protein [Methylobacterium nigriterrae]|uniref:hypothetical protein n=1 Tax=Methylobacterium nigriterrae TaxID=3127512 RepID=UPI003013F59A
MPVQTRSLPRASALAGDDDGPSPSLDDRAATLIISTAAVLMMGMLGFFVWAMN